jgi:hypothetical protein
MHGLAGRLVDAVDIALGAARQIDLQTGMAEIEQPGAEGVAAPAQAFDHEAALGQRRQQMVASRDVEPGAGGQIRQAGFAAGLGQGFQQRDRPIDRLDAAALRGGARRNRALVDRDRRDIGHIRHRVSLLSAQSCLRNETADHRTSQVYFL